MWLLRSARPADLPDLLRLAAKLDSINLPKDDQVIGDLIRRSQESFSSKKMGLSFGQFLFVLEDLRRRRVVGSSQILDKHGIVNRPHISFRTVKVEKFSRTTEKQFTHHCLKLEWNPEGITEIGGLILDESYRSHPDKLGKILSFGRFLYMAMQPEKFRDEILAELLPPFDKDGRSPFWEHVGRKFTGMGYKEANTNCRTNAEFIFSLFPHTLIYTNLLPDKIQKLIGSIHPDTMPVKKMLEEIGFRYSGEVCPFDGGPHYRARREEVLLIKRAREARVQLPSRLKTPRADLQPVLAGSLRNGFSAVPALMDSVSDSVGLDAAARRSLGVRAGERVKVIPFSW